MSVVSKEQNTTQNLMSTSAQNNKTSTIRQNTHSVWFIFLWSSWRSILMSLSNKINKSRQNRQDLTRCQIILHRFYQDSVRQFLYFNADSNIELADIKKGTLNNIMHFNRWEKMNIDTATWETLAANRATRKRSVKHSAPQVGHLRLQRKARSQVLQPSMFVCDNCARNCYSGIGFI